MNDIGFCLNCENPITMVFVFVIMGACFTMGIGTAMGICSFIHWLRKKSNNGNMGDENG